MHLRIFFSRSENCWTNIASCGHRRYRPQTTTAAMATKWHRNEVVAIDRTPHCWPVWHTRACYYDLLCVFALRYDWFECRIFSCFRCCIDCDKTYKKDIEPNSSELTGSNYSGISLWTQTKQNKCPKKKKTKYTTNWKIHTHERETAQT